MMALPAGISAQSVPSAAVAIACIHCDLSGMVNGRSAAEVARAFGVSPGFVRILRHRGLAREKKVAHVA